MVNILNPVAEIKSRLVSLENTLKIEDLNLSFEGRKLKDELLLTDYNIGANSVISIGIRDRTGWLYITVLLLLIIQIITFIKAYLPNTPFIIIDPSWIIVNPMMMVIFLISSSLMITSDRTWTNWPSQSPAKTENPQVAQYQTLTSYDVISTMIHICIWSIFRIYRNCWTNFQLNCKKNRLWRRM